MNYPKKCCVLILAATILAVGLRVPRLGQRPMHGDEAVNAEKFGLLLENGDYKYNRAEYHGPTLNYLTLIPAWLSSAGKFTEVTEFTLRIVPVAFGALLVLLLLLVADGLGRAVAGCAAVLAAVSPAMVFYSRYYIHEMLLVCFTFGVIACGWRYTQNKNMKWALLTGAFLGLTYATKETCIIAFGSMLSAVLLLVIIQRRQGDKAAALTKTIRPWHIVIAIATALVVSALFYSSFLTNPDGIADSVRAYAGYFNRAGQNQSQTHPWYYYLRMLVYSRYLGGPIWSEGLIVLLAAVGLVAAMTRKGVGGVSSGLLRFIAFYTIVMTVLYSAIPYKTPWCFLSFLHGMILLAGVGAVTLVKLCPNIRTRCAVCLLLAAGTGHLAWQGYLGSYRYYADVTNPYVYAHTTTDIYTITQQIEDVAKAHPDREDMYIQVICPEHDYWPLPWYLRGFSKIAWQDNINNDTPAAEVIIASAGLEQAVIKKIYEQGAAGEKKLYVPLFDSVVQLRPQSELLGFVTKELYDRWQQEKTIQSQIK